MPGDGRNERQDVEAAEHLLGDQSDGNTDERTSSSTPINGDLLTKLELPYARIEDSWRPLKLGLSLVFLIIFGVISLSTAYSVFAKSRATPTPPPIADSERPGDNPYILNPLWNYEAESQRREYFWTVTDKELNPDGVYRPMVVINGDFPGPLIEINEGDTIVVHVDNQATNATSIHWHGLYQNGTNHMDGTVGVTQCPIAPGTKFTYEFKVEGQSGTYWYHAHHAVQASDGMYGPLVIHSRDEKQLQKIEYATDQIVMVSDHYHDLSGSLLYQYLQPDRENAEPVPASALINGRGVRNCDDLPNRRCDNTTTGVGHPVFNLESDKTHRLRFINTGAFAQFQIQLDEHEFAVTEADGTDLIPRYYHRLNILPAQRYSIIVNTNHTDKSSYWLRARMVTHCFAEPNPELEAELHAIVQYTSKDGKMKDLAKPNSKDWPEIIETICKDMNTTELEPIAPIPIPQKADHQVYLRSNFEIGAWRLSRGFFNSSSWRPNVQSPSLHRIIDGVKEGNQSFLAPFAEAGNRKGKDDAGFGTSVAAPAKSLSISGVNSLAFETKRELVYQVDGIQVIDVIVSNFDDGDHPFHLHGHKFWVLATGKGYPPNHISNLNYGSSYPGTGNSDAPSSLDGVDINQKNPLYRDTATVAGFGWAALRFVADNAGVWAFHCHVSWHAEAGLLMQFVVRSDEMKEWAIPEAMKHMCTNEGVVKGSGPEDSIYEF